jgi:hypothetical protein
MGIGIFTPKVAASETVSTMPVIEGPTVSPGGAPVIDMVKTLDGADQNTFSPAQEFFDSLDYRLTQAENTAQAASFNGGPTAVIIEKSNVSLPVLALAAAGIYFLFWRKR